MQRIPYKIIAKYVFFRKSKIPTALFALMRGGAPVENRTRAPLRGEDRAEGVPQVRLRLRRSVVLFGCGRSVVAGKSLYLHVMESQILKGLNQAQRDAVVNYDSPSLIIAGAGSGKTRVLTSRIAYMIEQGVAPYNILALTFTNKAAEQMRERIAQMLPDGRHRYIRMGTFHSVFRAFCATTPNGSASLRVLRFTSRRTARTF